MAASRSAAGAMKLTALVLCVVALLALGTVHVVAETRAGDVSALKELASAWSGVPLNWRGDPCDDSWRGIKCDRTTNPATVTELNLADNGVQGSLPPAIGDLIYLKVLELSHNEGLTGPLPKELGQLTQLSTLSLQWCSFVDQIPSELGNLRQLFFLGLNGNQFDGPVPSSIGRLQRLAWLDLSRNKLTGPLPVSTSPGSDGVGLDNMTDVRHFHFNDNQLSGAVPPEIFSPSALIHIILDHNRLVSNIPRAISNAQNLVVLRLDNNRLNGSIPDEVSQLPSLENLNLQNNFFSGNMPDLSNLTSLELLDVSNNELSAPNFPTWITSLRNLTTLNLAHNTFTGEIDPSLFSMSQLQSLNLSRNRVAGSLRFPGNSALGLQWIDVTNNSITGFVGQPEFNGHAVEAVQIMLEGNPLCENRFLRFRNLACGELSLHKRWSPLPNVSCSSVECIDGKKLNRKTCACAYSLEVNLVLTAPTLSNLTDDFALGIETEIASRATAEGVALDPSQVVVAAGSNLDDTRYSLDLLFFPVAGDQLSDGNATEIVAALNERRLSLSYGPYQVLNGPLTANTNSRSGTAGLSAGEIAGIVVGSSALVLLVIAYGVLQKIRADRAIANHPFASWGAGGKNFGDAPKLKGARWFSLAELKLATHDWSQQNEIGRGGFGIVYKGFLKSGEVVAIKRAQEGSMQGATEFKNEIELLSRVHHRNLVGLVGFCYEGGEQALIYELMSNGSLRDLLHGQGPAPFSWLERLEIARNSARGIAYLHDHANPPIIHRDVKSANILLNHRHVAKVADFGLSKPAPDDGEMKVYSEHVKGTMGYLDPEYYTTFKFTDRSDVYAFGVVLLELLIGKPPIVNGKFVVREVRMALERGGLTEIRLFLDPALKDLPDADLKPFLKIALKCVEETSDDRDSMADVVKQLDELVGAHSNAAVGAQQQSDINFEALKPTEKLDDPDVYFPSPPPAGNKEEIAAHPNLHYSANSQSLRSNFRAVASRLNSPRLAAKRRPSPMSQRADED